MSVNIVTPWYINKVKNVLFHCYFLFQANMYKWWIFFNRFHHFQCLKAQSLLTGKRNRTSNGWRFFQSIRLCMHFMFFSCSYDICPVKSVLFGRKFWKFRKDITGLWCHLKVMRFIRNTCGCPTLLSLFLKLTWILKYALFPLYLQQPR